MLLFKTVAIWISILVLAVANGWLREAVLTPSLGRTAGLLLSGSLLSLVILAVAYASLPWLGAESTAELITAGSIWLILTLAFEIGYGYLIQGKSWPAILQAYTFHDGNLWPLVLWITAIAPYVASKLRALLTG